MFHEARIKLTAWYLLIIVAISVSFSVAIYLGVNRELTRIEDFQKARIQRTVSRLPAPFDVSQIPDSDAIAEARTRILISLGIINLIIAGVAGGAGYFLAGQTLSPIAKMMDEQKEFIGNASHELRTPLTSLRTEIEVALRSKKMTLGGAQSLIKSNLEDVNKMQKLSNYLLELNKYEKGVNGTPMAKVDLKEIVIKAIGKEKVKTNLKKSIILGNEDSLIELITILLDNAKKYSGKTKNVEIRVKSGGVLEIEDHGVGISEEDLPHIFDRFYRSDKSRSKDGYGLGLSIAKSIVDLHKGKIEVESKVGKGTIFSVYLG